MLRTGPIDWIIRSMGPVLGVSYIWLVSSTFKLIFGLKKGGLIGRKLQMPLSNKPIILAI